MDHRGDAVAIAGTNLIKCSAHCLVRAEIEVDCCGGRRRIGRTSAIEADDPIALAKLGDQRGRDEAARARDQNDAATTLAAAGFTAFAIGHELLSSFVRL